MLLKIRPGGLEEETERENLTRILQVSSQVINPCLIFESAPTPQAVPTDCVGTAFLGDGDCGGDEGDQAGDECVGAHFVTLRGGLRDRSKWETFRINEAKFREG